jgi:hypothetical protein
VCDNFYSSTQIPIHLDIYNFLRAVYIFLQVCVAKLVKFEAYYTQKCVCNPYPCMGRNRGEIREKYLSTQAIGVFI